MAGVPGIGRIHPIRRFNSVIDAMVNYDPRTGPAYQQKTRPSSVVPPGQQKLKQQSLKTAQTRYRHDRQERVMKALKGK
jgi:hypothetical protein